MKNKYILAVFLSLMLISWWFTLETWPISEVKVYEKQRIEECSSSEQYTNDLENIIVCLQYPSSSTPNSSIFVLNNGEDPVTVRMWTGFSLHYQGRIILLEKKSSKMIPIYHLVDGAKYPILVRAESEVEVGKYVVRVIGKDDYKGKILSFCFLFIVTVTLALLAWRSKFFLIRSDDKKFDDREEIFEESRTFSQKLRKFMESRKDWHYEPHYMV